MNTLIKLFLISLTLLAAAIGALAIRSTTPTFRDAQQRVISHSIASLEKVQLGGLDQYILIRGQNKKNPIVLFLHGGPGMPMMYLAHKFQKELEKHFVVVHWDQRGAGKSYSAKIPVETMNVEQFISDTHSLVQWLLQRFGQEKIYLVGHSWGSYLGMLVLSRYPEFFHAYVGIGQVVDGEKAKMIAHRFIRTQAQKLGDHVALDAMAKRPNVVRENYLFKYGAELHNATSWVPFVWTGLAAPEYSLFDIMNIAKGPQFSNKHMKYNAIQGSLFEEITKVNVPLYFFCGKYDYVTPTELVQDYYQKLEAPSKHLVEFENSAHFAFYEEPQKFTETILMVLGETSK